MMKDLQPYLIEFEEDRSMKTKEYLNNYIIRRDKCYLIIIITHNECIFFTNNRIWKV